MNEEDFNVQTIQPRSNCTNTLKKLYNEEEELVQKLNFFSVGKRVSKSLSLYKKIIPSVEQESKASSNMKGSYIKFNE
jgi:hypothetical protein